MRNCFFWWRVPELHEWPVEANTPLDWLIFLHTSFLTLRDRCILRLFFLTLWGWLLIFFSGFLWESCWWLSTAIRDLRRYRVVFFRWVRSSRFLFFSFNRRVRRWVLFWRTDLLDLRWRWLFLRGRVPFWSGRRLAWESSRRWVANQSFLRNWSYLVWSQLLVSFFYRSRRCIRFLSWVYWVCFKWIAWWLDVGGSLWHRWVFGLFFIFRNWMCRCVWGLVRRWFWMEGLILLVDVVDLELGSDIAYHIEFSAVVGDSVEDFSAGVVGVEVGEILLFWVAEWLPGICMS